MAPEARGVLTADALQVLTAVGGRRLLAGRLAGRAARLWCYRYCQWRLLRADGYGDGLGYWLGPLWWDPDPGRRRAGRRLCRRAALSLQRRGLVALSDEGRPWHPSAPPSRWKVHPVRPAPANDPTQRLWCWLLRRMRPLTEDETRELLSRGFAPDWTPRQPGAERDR